MRRRTFLALTGTVPLTFIIGCIDNEETEEVDDELEPEVDEEEDDEGDDDDDIGS
jgi:hypothetical protein